MNEQRGGGGGAAGGVHQAPAAPAPDTLWLVACHGPTGRKNSERTWLKYAYRSNPGVIVRMNARMYNHRRPARHESNPRGRLSTLGPAVMRVRALPHANNAVLVLFMHGKAGTVRTWGTIHSTGTKPRVNLHQMANNAQWDYRVFPITGWPQRNRNVHYRAFTQAVRGAQGISQVHLFGCRLGGSLFKDGLLDLAQDLRKEIWAYEGFTVTTNQRLRIVNRHSTTAVTAEGAQVHGQGGYRRLKLEANGGKLPGWQVRSYMQGQTPQIDLYVTGLAGGHKYVEVHNRQTLRAIFTKPLRTERI